MNRLKASIIKINCRLQSANLRKGIECDFADIAGRRYAFLKADGIGDFVLSSAFLNYAYSYFNNAEITLFCNDLLLDFAKMLYPRWEIISLRKNAHPGVGIWPTKPLVHDKLNRLPAFDALVDLKSWRLSQDGVVASWIPAHYKIAVRSHATAHPLADCLANAVYTSVLEVSFKNRDEATCADLQNYRALANRIFGISPELPLIPTIGTIQCQPTCDFPEDSDTGNFMVIAPFAGHPYRDVPPHLIVSAVRDFAMRAGLSVCLVGARERQAESEELVKVLSAHCKCENFVGKLLLHESVCLIQRSRVFLGSESGLAHVSIASNIPSVIIIGGGHWGLFAPWGESSIARWITTHLPCFNCDWNCIFKEARCLLETEDAKVTSALQGVLATHALGK